MFVELHLRNIDSTLFQVTSMLLQLEILDLAEGTWIEIFDWSFRISTIAFVRLMWNYNNIISFLADLVHLHKFV